MRSYLQLAFQWHPSRNNRLKKKYKYNIKLRSVLIRPSNEYLHRRRRYSETILIWLLFFVFYETADEKNTRRHRGAHHRLRWAPIRIPIPKVIARKRFYCYDVTLRLWSRKPFIYYACDIYIYIYTYTRMRSCSVWYITFSAKRSAVCPSRTVLRIIYYIVRLSSVQYCTPLYYDECILGLGATTRSRGRKNITRTTTQTTEKIKRKERKNDNRKNII